MNLECGLRNGEPQDFGILIADFGMKRMRRNCGIRIAEFGMDTDESRVNFELGTSGFWILECGMESR